MLFLGCLALNGLVELVFAPTAAPTIVLHQLVFYFIIVATWSLHMSAHMIVLRLKWSEADKIGDGASASVFKALLDGQPCALKATCICAACIDCRTNYMHQKREIECCTECCTECCGHCCTNCCKSCYICLPVSCHINQKAARMHHRNTIHV